MTRGLAASGEGRSGLDRSPRALPLRDLLQLSLDRSSAREQAAIHLLEIIVRGIEDEAAGYPNGDADGPAAELD